MEEEHQIQVAAEPELCCCPWSLLVRAVANIDPPLCLPPMDAFMLVVTKIGNVVLNTVVTAPGMLESPSSTGGCW